MRVPSIVVSVLSFASIVMPAGGTTPTPQAEAFQRRPLQGTAGPMSPSKQLTVRNRTDPVTGQVVAYDPKPNIVAVDVRRGLYDLVWIGEDQREKRIRYSRPDANQVIVRANARIVDGSYLYEYDVENLQESGQSLAGFSVQTFGEAVPFQWKSQIGRMGSGLLGPGNWWRYVFTIQTADLAPGSREVVRLRSDTPPGIVECAVDGGTRGMKGIGEDPPDELLEVLHGYEALPRGITVGPDDRLDGMTTPQRIAQVAAWLPLFRDAGWISRPRHDDYVRVLQEKGLPALAASVERDVSSRQAAPEIAVVLRRIAR